LGARLSELKGELADHYKAMRAMPAKKLGGRDLYNYFGGSLGADEAEVHTSWDTVRKGEPVKGTMAKVPEILECYESDDCGAGGSVWQAYNAVTMYETHKDGRTPERRQRNMLFQAGKDVANRAFGLAARLAA
jgi:hypothetical protein